MQEYLRDRVRLSYLVPLLIPIALFIAAADSASGLLIPPLLLGSGLLLFRAPRDWTYGLLLVGLLLFAYAYVFHVAPGDPDTNSDRDEQVEIAARAFLEGENPWNRRSTTGNVITAGPASVLLAVLPVALFDGIEELTFLFYVAFFGVLLLGDLRRRNDSFPLLALLFVTGQLGIRHTMMFSLEELYFWFLVLALAWNRLQRDQPLWAGVFLALPVLARPSYAFPVFAMLCWYWFGPRRTRTGVIQLVFGGLAGVVLVLMPFFVMHGTDLLHNNPWVWASSLLSLRWPDTNVVFSALNRVYDLVGRFGMGWVKLAVSLPLIAWASHRMARLNLGHPFWHVCLGAFAANMIAFTHLPLDYILFILVPGFLALAWSEHTLAYEFRAGG